MILLVVDGTILDAQAAISKALRFFSARPSRPRQHRQQRAVSWQQGEQADGSLCLPALEWRPIFRDLAWHSPRQAEAWLWNTKEG